MSGLLCDVWAAGWVGPGHSPKQPAWPCGHQIKQAWHPRLKGTESDMLMSTCRAIEVVYTPRPPCLHPVTLHYCSEYSCAPGKGGPTPAQSGQGWCHQTLSAFVIGWSIDSDAETATHGPLISGSASQVIMMLLEKLSQEEPARQASPTRRALSQVA